MSQVQIDFSKIAAQDLSGQMRPRPTPLPSTHDFASMIDAGNKDPDTPPHMDTRPARSSRHREASSSRQTDSTALPDRPLSGRINRADAASNLTDDGPPSARDRAASTPADDSSAPHRVAEPDQHDGKTDGNDDAAVASAPVPAVLQVTAVTAIVQPGILTPDGTTADVATPVDAATAAVSTLSGVPPGHADATRGDAEKVAENGRPAIAALLTAVAQKKPGGESTAADDETAAPEAAENDAALDSLSAAEKPTKGGEPRVPGGASVTAPAGDRPTAHEQQVQPLPPDVANGAKPGVTAQTSPADAQARVHAKGAPGEPDAKEVRDDGTTVQTNEPRIGAIQALAGANAASSISSVVTQAGIVAIGSVSAGGEPATAASAAPRADAASAAVPLTDIGVEIATQAKAGHRSFDIRLDPPELGHVYVRLDVDRDGNVVSRLVVDRAETLDLLRRDAPQLERALQDAGLKADAQTMQFSLRHQNAGQQDGQNTQRSAPRTVDPDAAARPDEVPLSYGRLGSRAGGLDIRI